MTLKDYEPMTNKVSIYVPGTSGVDTAADTSDYIRSAAELLSTLYGGATAVKSSGYWVSDSAGLVEEQVCTIYAYCKELHDEDLDKVVRFCEIMKVELMQEAVSLEVNNQLYLI